MSHFFARRRSYIVPAVLTSALGSVSGLQILGAETLEDRHTVGEARPHQYFEAEDGLGDALEKNKILQMLERHGDTEGRVGRI